MPCLIVKTNHKLSDEEKSKYTDEIGKILAKNIGKPLDYCMVVLEDNVAIRFAGDDSKAVFMSLMSIGGLNKSVNKKISKALTEFFTAHGFDGSRIYIVFNSKSAEDWGFNGDTFA